MSTIKEINVPDIGDTNPVEVIEVLVSEGDVINAEDALITLESEKASMDVPSPLAGTVKQLNVKVGDKITQGDLILSLQVNGAVTETADAITPMQLNTPPEPAGDKPAPTQSEVTVSSEQIITLPDLGTDDAVSVIEVLIKPGQHVEQDETLVTLESDKASMDVPALAGGDVIEVYLKEGDSVKSGQKVAKMVTRNAPVMPANNKAVTTEPEATSQDLSPANEVPSIPPAQAAFAPNNGNAHAGPATRRLASELGVILDQVKGTGRRGRIVSSDVKAFVKQTLKSGGAKIQGAGLTIEAMPEIDFSQFGDISVVKLSRIKKLTAKSMARNWVSIPHVTQFDEADVTELEDFRNQNKQAAMDNGIRLTPLAFILKGVVGALQRYPQFNASLSNDGQDLIMKQYIHLGVAVNTPNGLVVPVIRHVDKKGIFEIARELGDLSKKAREGKLTREQMQGQSFTISSLGNLGGTAFTPIINAPDVAILGLAKMQTKPVYINKQFEARKMLPLCLSYDHRVIDGAEAALFTSKIADMLQDIRNMLL